MSLYDQFEMNTDAEVDGILLDYGDGGRIRIARAGGSNKRFVKRVEAFQRKHKRSLDLDILNDEVVERELREIYADTIVLGFEHGPDDAIVQGELPGRTPDDPPIRYSRESVIKLFTDLPELFADVRTQSTSAALFREVQKAADSGNS